MGISTEIKLPSSVVAKYHKIDSVPGFLWKEDGSGNIELIISQYTSYEDKLAGAKPVSKSFKTFDLGDGIVGIIRFILYKAVLPLAPEFATTEPVQDGEIGNMLQLLKYLNPDEMSVIVLALQDILALINVDPESQRDWYERLKEGALESFLQ